MPRMDGTGPAGQGPMTGRGLGPCGTGGIRTPQSNLPQTSWVSRLWGAVGGLGLGMGRGGGRGLGGGRRQGQGRRRTF